MKKREKSLSLMEFVHLLRVLFYIIAILFVTAIACVKMLQADLQNEVKQEAFWPPDFIPHPIPPWDDPREPKPDMIPCEHI